MLENLLIFNKSINAATAFRTLCFTLGFSSLYGVAGAADTFSHNRKTLDTSKIELVGTMAATEQHMSRAILSDGGDTQFIYAVGDKVNNGTTIKAIGEAYVILQQGGRDKLLQLKPSAAATGALELKQDRSVELNVNSVNPPADPVLVRMAEQRAANIYEAQPRYVEPEPVNINRDASKKFSGFKAAKNRKR